MPQAPGFARRGTPTTGESPGATLVLAVPTGVQDGDLLLLGLHHQSGGFATPPAGWTLVARDTTGTVWTELYWRRAASEPVDYTVTGLATITLGCLYAYSGLLAAGNPVDVASARVVAGGSFYRLTAQTSTVPQGLVVALVGVDGIPLSAQVQTRYDADSLGVLAPMPDPGLAQFTTYTPQTTSGGTGIALSVHEAMQIMPGSSGEGRSADLFGTDLPPTVGIWAVFAPEPASTSTAGTRYYPGYRAPLLDPIGDAYGSYDATGTGPRGYGGEAPLWELVQQKPLSGDWTSVIGVRNLAGVSVLTHRFLTPPLQAGTLGGTIDLCQYVNALTIGIVGVASIRLHVVAYVTQGDTTEARGVLLDYVDTVDYPTASVEWRRLAAPQPVAPVVRLAGDRICVEIAVDLLSPAVPTPPTRPPSQMLRWLASRGACSGGSVSLLRCAGVPFPDAVAGETGTDFAPWIEFSETVPELASTLPTVLNVSCAAGTVIAALPYTDTVLTREVATPGNAVWYRYTAASTGRLIAHVLGSSGGLEIHVYDACGDEQTGNGLAGQQSSDRVASSDTQILTACAFVILDAQAGSTYHFRVRTVLDSANVASGGSRVVFSVVPYQPLGSDDVIIASQSFLARYTSAGDLADLAEVGGVLSGLAVDYTGRPIVEINDGVTVHTGPRLVVAQFNGAQVLLVDAAYLTNDVGVLDTIFTPLPSGAEFPSSVAVDDAGRLWVGYFGNGFTRVANAGTSYLDDTATDDTAPIALTDAVYGDNQPGGPFPAATVFSVALDAGGTNYLDLTPDGARLFYTSGGWYVPVGGTALVEIDPLTGGGIATRTVAGGPGPNPGLKGLQPLDDGTVLVCAGSVVYRVATDGTILQTYTPTPSSLSRSLADVEVLEDGASFWVLDELSTTLHKFDLATGAQLISIYTRLGYGTCTSCVVFRPNGVEPPNPPGELPTACPVTLVPTAAGGGSACPVTLVP